MDNFTRNNSIILKYEGNSMIKNPEPIKECSKCCGEGFIESTEIGFWDFMEGWNQKHPPYESKICDMLKMYHKWKDTGLIPCPECF